MVLGLLALLVEYYWEDYMCIQADQQTETERERQKVEREREGGRERERKTTTRVSKEGNHYSSNSMLHK